MSRVAPLLSRTVLAGLFGLAGGASCYTPPPVMPMLATAQVASDFQTYRVRRVGLLPFAGKDLSPDESRDLQLAFFSEMSGSTPFELVPLDAGDLEEVALSDPHRRGWYRPETIIALSRRYSLDAVFFGSVVQQRLFPPQILSLQTDLVSAETGLVLWSSSIHLDASNPRVREGLQIFYGDDTARETGAPSWDLSLLSPERFARFAAFQVACLL